MLTCKIQSSRKKGIFDDNLGIIFLISHETICCDPSNETSHRDMVSLKNMNRDGSDEGSQHMVLLKNKKINLNSRPILPLI